MQLHAGSSDDGITWRLEEEPIQFAEPDFRGQTLAAGYDPRVIRFPEDDRYYVVWCAYYGGATLGLAWTKDFKTFHRMDDPTPPWNRNGVLFPRKVKGSYVLLHRPGGPGHNNYGNIFLSHSPDLVHWGRHRLVMKTLGGWQSTKIGAGPVPIETSEGWLLIYHGVLTSCNGFIYSAGVALLDLDAPEKVVARARPYILSPQTLYECVGDVPNVVFPCAALCDAATGRLAIYYGCADTVVGMAFSTVDDLVRFAKENDGPA
jgi:beta-1,4-mannooligosaccharide/beta-1,4-mannosyl-N-acetylglucosamine phosphorylase